MDRRRFLRLTAAGGAAALVLPGWLARAFAQEPPRPESTTSLPTLVAAFREAQRLGKPLLVIVVPADATVSAVRASAFGELLNHGPDDAFRDLSLAHVVCATMDEVRTLAPQTPAGEPVMVLVETDAVPARVSPVDARLPGADRIWDSTDADIDGRIAALAAAIHGALARDAAMLASRARVARAHLDPTTLARADAALHGAQLDPGTADRAAALVYAAPAPAARTALLAGVMGRLRVSRVPGSVWASSTGCGIDIEGGEPSMVDCGMGHTPPRSARFLHFYVRH